MRSDSPLISILLPCRNERTALGECLHRIQAVLRAHGVDAEVIVSDSSDDRSHEVAYRHNARVVRHDRIGYGAAIQQAAAHARGRYLLIVDADGTYELERIPAFISELERGADMVMGIRTWDRMECRAMPLAHKYLGNPLLTFLLRITTGARVRDAHCGMRAVSRVGYERINPHTDGMEFASELVLEAHRRGLDIREVPVAYTRRRGESKLRTMRDGWRHLRFMLLYSPVLLFFTPGLLLGVAGVISLLLVLAGITFGVQPFLFALGAAAAVIIGYQLVIFGVFARVFAAIHLDHPSELLNRAFRYLTVEAAGLAALGLIGVSVGIFLAPALTSGELSSPAIVTALTALIVGVQTLFSSFMISLLSIKKSA